MGGVRQATHKKAEMSTFLWRKGKFVDFNIQTSLSGKHSSPPSPSSSRSNTNTLFFLFWESLHKSTIQRSESEHVCVCVFWGLFFFAFWVFAHSLWILSIREHTFISPSKNVKLKSNLGVHNLSASVIWSIAERGECVRGMGDLVKRDRAAMC